jgi:hypothetical protein
MLHNIDGSINNSYLQFLIAECIELYIPGDTQKDLMWKVVEKSNLFTLANEQDELYEIIDEYWNTIIESVE